LNSDTYMVEVAKFFARRGYITTSSGQISVRDSKDAAGWWTFPLGVDYLSCSPNDLVFIRSGKVSHNVNPASIVLHQKIYDERPDVRSIMHYHPINVVAWSTLRLPLPLLTQESCLFFDDIVSVPFKGVIETTKESERIVDYLGDKNTAILDNHGALTVGESIRSAAYRMVMLEQCCEIALKVGGRGVPLSFTAKDRQFFANERVMQYQFDMYRRNNE